MGGGQGFAHSACSSSFWSPRLVGLTSTLSQVTPPPLAPPSRAFCAAEACDAAELACCLYTTLVCPARHGELLSCAHTQTCADMVAPGANLEVLGT